MIRQEIILATAIFAVFCFILITKTYAEPSRWKYDPVKALEIVVPDEYHKYLDAKSKGVDIDTAEVVIALTNNTWQAVIERSKDKSTGKDELTIARFAITEAWNRALTLWKGTKSIKVKNMIIDEWNMSMTDNPNTAYIINVLGLVCKREVVYDDRIIKDPEIPLEFLSDEFYDLFDKTNDYKLITAFGNFFITYGTIIQENKTREKLNKIRLYPVSNKKIIEYSLSSIIRIIQRKRIFGYRYNISNPEFNDGLPWP